MAAVTPLRTRRRRLAPEPWGSRLTRAREQVDYTLRDLDRAKAHLGFGRGPIHDLEQLQDVPEDPTQRRRAFLLITFLGFDPADFGLDDGDAPTVIDLRALRDLGETPTKWYAPVVPLRVAAVAA